MHELHKTRTDKDALVSRCQQSQKNYLRFVTAAVSVKFTLSSGVKAIAAADATASASTGPSAAAASSHWSVTNWSKEMEVVKSSLQGFRSIKS